MILKVAILLLVLSCLWRENAGEIFKDDIELERQLKLLNKPALKTFKTKEGDIIDCVNIYAQPALNHPLLKNHKVQTSPSASFLSNFPENSQDVKSASALVNTREPCPNGTVPIVRVHKQDLIMARSLPKELSFRSGQHNKILPGQHVVSLGVNTPKILKFGAGGEASIYNLTLQSDQFSMIVLWIESGPLEANMIIAGWGVFPQLNGDGLSRLITYWTGKDNKSCYNTLCPGFVQTDRTITPNYPLLHTSIAGGKQRTVKIQVKQDRQTGNWWFVVIQPDVIHMVGYWPKELFEYLTEGTQYVAYGGLGKAGQDGMVPPLGSGEFNGDYYRTCTFAKLHYIDSNDKPALLRPHEFLTTHLDQCYGFEYYGYIAKPRMQCTVLLGGPGGRCS